MKPIIQTKISSQDGTISGNCFRACLASIMEIDIDSIPAFKDMGRDWHMPFFKFLDDNGYALPFEVVSILLLAALIGCIVIALKSKPETT